MNKENLDCKPYKPSESKEFEYIWNVDQLPIHFLTGRSYGLLAFTKLGLKKIIAEKVGKGWKLQWTCTEMATELRRGCEEAAAAWAEDTIQLYEAYSENKMPSVKRYPSGIMREKMLIFTLCNTFGHRHYRISPSQLHLMGITGKWKRIGRYVQFVEQVWFHVLSLCAWICVNHKEQ